MKNLTDVLKDLTREQYQSLSSSLRKNGHKSGLTSYPDYLETREDEAKQLQEASVGGVVHLYVWGRDCDMCESSHVTTIPNSVLAYEKYRSMVYDNAEGPTRIEIISAEEAEEFQPTFRDRAAEAWENGNGTSVYV